MCRVRWIQHAVGHGGFHTGQIYPRGDAHTDGGNPSFTWIFDCGSRASSRLDGFVRLWTRLNGSPVDWLFISHFDYDHVSGLDELMSRSVVNDVMVPYVNEGELAYSLLEEISRGNLAPAFTALVADPASFFLARGARRVTFLAGREGERTPEGGAPPGDPGDGLKTDGGWLVKMPRGRALDVPASIGASAESEISVQVVDGGLCHLEVSRDRCSLRLKAYCAPISSGAHNALLAALHAKFGTIPWTKSRPGLGDLAYAIAHHARTSTGRNDLRSIFATHVGSSNRSSLSLLSLPQGDDSQAWFSTNGSPPYWEEEGPAAWMSTGDAELLDPADLADWAYHFRPELNYVRILALPHHGSDHNSDVALQRACSNARLIAAVKAGAKKHPGPIVAGAAGARLSLVTGDTASAVEMWAYL